MKSHDPAMNHLNGGDSVDDAPKGDEPTGESLYTLYKQSDRRPATPGRISK